MKCGDCRHWWMIEPSQPIMPPAKPEFAPRLPRMGMCKQRENRELFTSRYGKCEEYEA